MLRMKNFNLNFSYNKNLLFLFNFKISRKFFGIAHNIINYKSDENPRVFLTVSKDENKLGTMTFELYANHCPRTVENFRQLCTGENKRKLCYKGVVFNKIINGFLAQGGDISKKPMSIYGGNFRDENLTLQHYKRGILSMANQGPDSNNTEFFITFVDAPWLNGYHVVVGELVEGEEVLDKIEQEGKRDGNVKSEVKITDCGQVFKH